LIDFTLIVNQNRTVFAQKSQKPKKILTKKHRSFIFRPAGRKTGQPVEKIPGTDSIKKEGKFCFGPV